MSENKCTKWKHMQKYILVFLLLLCPWLMLPIKFFITFNVRKITNISVGIEPPMIILGAILGAVISAVLWKAIHVKPIVLSVIWGIVFLGWIAILSPRISSVMLGFEVASMITSIPFIIGTRDQA